MQRNEHHIVSKMHRFPAAYQKGNDRKFSARSYRPFSKASFPFGLPIPPAFFHAQKAPLHWCFSSATAALFPLEQHLDQSENKWTQIVLRLFLSEESCFPPSYKGAPAFSESAKLMFEKEDSLLKVQNQMNQKKILLL